MMHISLSPNLEADDLRLAQAQLFNLSSWSQHLFQDQLTQQLAKLFPNAKAIYLFNSGRSALMIALKTLNLKPKTPILLQSFTCSAVPNAILWNGLQPEYLDIGGDFNLDSKTLPQTTQAKALILQHTFGLPGEIDQIKNYCQKHSLFLIEDCAHSLGAAYNNQPIGSFGDMAILSFGRDKVISSVFGGALIVNNPQLVNCSNQLYSAIPTPGFWWTTQQLLHPLITNFVKNHYSLFGKAFLSLSQKLKLISKAIYPLERAHLTPPIFPGKLPEPLAKLALNQLNKLSRFNNHRQQIAFYYQQNLTNPAIQKPDYSKNSIYLRYTITLSQPENLRQYLIKHQIILDKNPWYRQPVTPSNNLFRAGYSSGSCPTAERICQTCLNLPTNPLTSFKDAQFIVKLINQWSS